MENQGVSKKSHKGIVVLLGIIVVAAAAIAGGVALGVLYGGVKSADETVTVRRVVCTADVIKEYNQVSAQVASSQADIERISQERRAASEKIAKLPSMDQDPTCLYAAVTGELQAGNASTAKQYVATIKDFAAKGIFADTTLYGIVSIDILDQQVESIEKFGPTNQSGTSSGDTAPKD